MQRLTEWARRLLGRPAAALERPPFYDDFRQPKSIGGVAYDPAVIARILAQLDAERFTVRSLRVDAAAYAAYRSGADYESRYPDYYSFNLPEKSLEHFIAAELLGLARDDVYIDVASEGSPVPDIYARIYGCRSYRQDLAYPPGLNGDTIGGDAAAMPIADAFASKLGLHCSFEHFEGDADVRFARSLRRVLRPGGRACIVPLYLFDTYAIQTDPQVSAPAGVAFEDDAVLYLDPTWQNRHGRFYDARHLATRVRDELGDLTLTVYRIENAREIDASCYAEFAAVITKPG